LFASFLLFLCGRREENNEQFVLPGLRLSLLDEYPDIQVETVPQRLKLRCREGDVFEYNVEITRKVKQKGRNMPSLSAEIVESFVLTERVEGRDDSGFKTSISLHSPVVTVDPEIAGFADEIAALVSSLEFEAKRHENGEAAGFSAVKGGSPAPEQAGVYEYMLRLTNPRLPEEEIVSGAGWDHGFTSAHTFLNGSSVETRISGEYVFKGTASNGEGENFAVIIFDYSLLISGFFDFPGEREKISGKISGNGYGKAVFFINAYTRKIEAAEVHQGEIMTGGISGGKRQNEIHQLSEMIIRIKSRKP